MMNAPEKSDKYRDIWTRRELDVCEDVLTAAIAKELRRTEECYRPWTEAKRGNLLQKNNQSEGAEASFICWLNELAKMPARLRL
ncbi:hypothetical protein YV76_003161 [Salmonella enterica subsp. enterica]|nr:hypothetical protein [Salmonella enterica subsp. enterica]